MAPSEIKALCFISESGKADLFTVDSLFQRRPKLPGLWARFTFRDGEQLDGILPHNLLDWPEAPDEARFLDLPSAQGALVFL